MGNFAAVVALGRVSDENQRLRGNEDNAGDTIDGQAFSAGLHRWRLGRAPSGNAARCATEGEGAGYR